MNLWKITLVTLEETFEWTSTSLSVATELVAQICDMFALKADENVAGCWYNTTAFDSFELYCEALTDIIQTKDDINISFLADLI